MSSMDNIILVTGAARSGTSMTAGILHLCGAFGGEMKGTSKSNRRGMYENVDITQHVVRPYLSSIGVDPRGQDPLPEPDKLLCVADWRYRVEQFLYAQKFDGEQVVFYKGAQSCLIWPIWHEAFPEARWIIVRRADEDIVYSCMRTGFMRAYKDKAGWQAWVDTHKRRFQEMHDAGLHIEEVWPSQFVAGEFSDMAAVTTTLGLKWDEQSIRDFIRPELFYMKGEDNGQ